jgi:hypothetical protein
MKIVESKLKDGRRVAAMSFSAREVFSLRTNMAGISYQMPQTKEEQREIRQHFGLFGSDANPNVFYPEIDVPADIAPKPEDFIEVPFRLLSSTIVAAGTWRATDFTKANVLKNSVGKLRNKPVFTQHDSDPLNWVGMILNPKWTNSFKQDGMSVPAGIDGIIAIDAKTNPKLARAVLMKGVHSFSVTVVFSWEPSHKFEDDSEFNNMVGRTAEDGKMIRRMATEILDYHEGSLVDLGADPFAKMLDAEGNLVHIDHSRVALRLEEEPDTVRNQYQNEKFYSVPCGLDRTLLSLSRKSVQVNSNLMNQELITALLSKFGVENIEGLTPEIIANFKTGVPEDVTAELESLRAVKNTVLAEFNRLKEEGVEELPEDFANGIQFVDTAEYSALAAKVESLGTQVTDLTKNNADLKAKVESLREKAQLGESFIKAKKDEVVRLYRASKPQGGVKEEIVSLFEKAEDAATLDALIEEHLAKATSKFHGKCQKCGSTEFSFQSSLVIEEDGNATDDRETSYLKSIDGLMERFQTPARYINVPGK